MIKSRKPKGVLEIYNIPSETVIIVGDNKYVEDNN